jgi:hypothetical protein
MRTNTLRFFAPATLILAPFVSSARGGGLVYSTFDPAGSTRTFAEAINASGTLTRVYQTSSTSTFQGYVRTASGTITEFNPSGSVDTHAVGINDAGTVVGQYGTGGSTYFGLILTGLGLPVLLALVRLRPSAWRKSQSSVPGMSR